MDTTDKVWVGLIGAALAYEAYTLVNKKGNDTLSESVWRHIARRPLVPFAVGFVGGHFLWQSQDVYDRELKRELEAVAEAATEAAKHA